MWIIAFLAICFCFIDLLIRHNNNLYCIVYNHEEYLLWKQIIKHIDTFVLDKEIFGNKYFISDKFPNHYIICWKNEHKASFQTDGECILSLFDKTRSKKVYDLLMKM